MTDTIIIQKKYDRNAVLYDLMELPIERLFYSRWRKKYFSPLKGKILDVGVGTGNNFESYNEKASITGIDFSKEMLKRAKNKLANLNKKNITLRLMNVENLEFKDDLFDYVVTSFVFCSVPHPLKGLKEIKRVLKPEGKLIMLEHVLSRNKFISFLENLFNPIVKFLIGVNVNRDTKKNIEKSGMNIKEEKNLAFNDIFRLFSAEKY